MSEKPTIVVDIPKDPNEKHRALLSDKTRLSEFGYSVGVRLLDLEETGDWRNITLGGPFPDWTTYMKNGVGMTEPQARKHMAAAHLPGWCTKQEGVEKVSLLYKIMQQTQAEETPEEAMALVLPLKGGGTKPFADMTADEVEDAYQLVRDGEARVKRPPRKPRLEESTQQHLELQTQAINAVAQWLKPRQFRVHERGGKALIDVTAVPEDCAAEVFERLASIMREHR